MIFFDLANSPNRSPSNIKQKPIKMGIKKRFERIHCIEAILNSRGHGGRRPAQTVT